MLYWALLLSAIVLSLERLTYFWVSHYPQRWRAFCRRPAVAALGQPVEVLQKLFYGFKVMQISVFLGWCAAFGDGAVPLPTGTPASITAGAALMLIGQTLNFGVFSRLGPAGVFYGRELGYDVPWVEGFPFSLLKHPQYVGTLLSIWGFFLVMRYPAGDWIVLPLLETVYYTIGARYEP